MYTHIQFAQDLEQQLQQGFNVEMLSDWAHWLRIDKYSEISPALNRIIQQIAVMGEGEEFEFSDQELLELSHKLIISALSEQELLDLSYRFGTKSENP